MRQRRRERIAGTAALAALAGLCLSGCADLARVTSLQPDAVDPTSAVAEEVRAASRADYATPKFTDVPPAVTDVRPVADWRRSVQSTVSAGGALTAWVASNPPFVGEDPEVFAEGQRASIPASERGASAPTDAVGTEAFAARLRALATPPSPPN